jgi:hypothetical protein
MTILSYSLHLHVIPPAYLITDANEPIEMWRRRIDQHSGADPVRIGGKRTALSLVIIAVIAIVLLLIIRFTIL